MARWIPLLVVALAATLRGQNGGVVVAGDHVRIDCAVADEALAKQALDVAERAWKHAAGIFGKPRRKPEEPASIHLYRTVAAYEEKEASLTGGRFKDNQSFSSFEEKAAFIVIQPVVSDEFLKIVGLPRATLRLVAHEAAHLACYTLVETHRSHPTWYAEGYSEWIEETVMRETGGLTSLEGDPHWSTRILKLQKRLEARELPEVEQVFDGSAEEDLDRSELYGYHHLLYRFLKDPSTSRKLTGRFKKLESDLLKLKPTGFTPALAKRIDRIFGKSVLKQLDDDLRHHLKELKPQWSQPFRALETAGEEWVQAAQEDLNAVAWRTDELAQPSWEITGEVRVLPGRQTQMNVIVDNDGSSFLQVCFKPDVGVTVLRHDLQSEWLNLIHVPCEALKLNELVPFRIASEKAKQLVVDVAGEQAIRLDLEDREMEGRWGLGALAGTAGIWREVAIKR